MSYTQVLLGENKEVISFKEYRKNPLEFIERLEEYINRVKENRWSIIKTLLHESFQYINDNWWMAIRKEVHSYPEFKQAFKTKYWSESIQNIIRDDLCNGRYDSAKGQTPTAYFPVSYTHLDVYKRQL